MQEMQFKHSNLYFNTKNTIAHEHHIRPVHRFLLTYKIAVFMGGGVSTMEPWTLGMVGWVAGGVCHSQEKRFLARLCGGLPASPMMRDQRHGAANDTE